MRRTYNSKRQPLRGAVNALITLAVVFGVCSCAAGPRQPNTALIGAGPGWSCMPTGSVRTCHRVANDCNVQSFKLEKAKAAPCAAATSATCVTYTEKGKEEAVCFAENKTCNEYRNFMAEKSEEVSATISVCLDMT